MANCSFIKATDARTRSRNDTLIWTEICEVQQAILAAIDAGNFSTIVNDGTPFTSTNAITAATLNAGGSGYTTIAATGLTGTLNSISYTDGIAANGTGGSGASVTPVVTGGVITSFTINSGGTGYTPVDATASVQAASNLTDAQDETNYNGSPNGVFAAGDDYFVGEVITLSENSTATVDAISATAVVTVAAQDETNFDGAGNNGTFAAGTGYVAAEQITLDDGTVITVDAVSSGAVTQFTVTSSSTTSFTSTTPRIQSSSNGSGTGFSITPGTNNETAVGTVTQFTIASVGVDPFYLGQTITQASTTGIGTGFNLVPSANNATTIAHGGSVAVLTPIVTGGAITSVVVNNGGTLYSAGQPIVFSHPTTGAGATAVVASVDGSGVIQSITVVTQGSGYDTVTALVAVDHPTGSGFVGEVVTTGGVVTGITIQNGGFGYATVFPTVTITDVTGSGANISVTGVSGGAIASIQLTAGGSAYSQTPSLAIFNSDGVQNQTADITVTVGANTYGTTPTDYYSVLSGQSSDVVISDQIQYVLDYFTALGYNIRAQVNPATGDTMQWQIIW